MALATKAAPATTGMVANKPAVLNIDDLSEEQREALFQQIEAKKQDTLTGLIERRNALMSTIEQSETELKRVNTQIWEIQPPPDGRRVYQGVYRTLNKAGKNGLTLEKIMEAKEVSLPSYSDASCVQGILRANLKPETNAKGELKKPKFAYDDGSETYSLFKFSES